MSASSLAQRTHNVVRQATLPCLAGNVVKTSVNQYDYRAPGHDESPAITLHYTARPPGLNRDWTNDGACIPLPASLALY
jgi:hypothetical protein